jgi:hypothetical protein
MKAHLFKTLPITMALGLAMLGGTSASLVAAQDQPPSKQGPNDGRPFPPFGKITAIHDASIDIAKPDGSTITVRITDKTEFRKDRQPAKRGDFKVGDLVLVRGTENEDHTWTAQTIASRSMTGGPGAQFFGPEGTLGKDYVVGEIKSIDAPKLTVLLPDNNVQTIELNEETSLRKGRESITMADIHVGDHLFARGGVQNNVFVPKMVVVIDAEQWKRMQEMREGVAPPPQNPQPKNRMEPFR